MNGTIIDKSKINGKLSNIIKLKGTIQDNKINGTIHNKEKLVGSIKDNKKILGTISCKSNMVATIVPGMISYPNYDGEYIITPGLEEQILETKNKITRENIEVKEIPYYENANEYGYTITIA